MTIHSGATSTMPTAPSRPAVKPPDATAGPAMGATRVLGPQRPRASSESDMEKAEAAKRRVVSTSKNYQPKVSIFHSVESTPKRFTSSLCPVNLLEQKERFLRFGITPQFVMRTSGEKLEKLTGRDRGQIRFTYLREAKMIIDAVKKKYGDGSVFIQEMFGSPVDEEYASDMLDQYLTEHGLQGQMTVYWTPDLSCTAKMMWHGPCQRYNRPEARKYTLLMKSSSENNFMRDIGITCLANHEIGTHYFRMVNDGLQPWFSDRGRFQLKQMSCREFTSSEEGLATVNTILQAKVKLLWTSAILYYTACMAAEMTFRELFDHLGDYMSDKEQRWKHVMRVKRGLRDASKEGGYGNDQCYFEGAVEILRNIDNIDFNLLYSGRVCLDELNRVRRLARLDCIKLPTFLKDIEKYKRTLRHIAIINGLIPRPTKPKNSKKPPTGSKRSRMLSHRNNASKSSEMGVSSTSTTKIKLLNTMPYGRKAVRSNSQSQASESQTSLTSLNTPPATAPLPEILSARDSESSLCGAVLSGCEPLLSPTSSQHSIIQEPVTNHPKVQPKKLLPKRNQSKEDVGNEKPRESFGLLDRSVQL